MTTTTRGSMKIEPVACYAGHRRTPEGTTEFYGHADKPLKPATMFYTEAQMRQLGESIAALVDSKEFALWDGDEIRELIKEMLG